MKAVTKYWHVFKISWQSKLEFRYDLLLRFLISTLSLIGVLFLFSTVVDQGSFDYSRKEISTYYVLITYLFFAFITGFGVANQIETGELSRYLVQPLDYLWYQYANGMATRLLRLVVGLPPLILILVLFRKDLVMSTNPVDYLILLLTSFGAMTILFLVMLLIEFLEFWIYRSYYLHLLTDLIIDFFAGALIPLSLLPIYLDNVIKYLPFKYTGFFVVDTFLGRTTLSDLLMGIALQWGWIVILIGLIVIVWQRGLKRYEAVGN